MNDVECALFRSISGCSFAKSYYTFMVGIPVSSGAAPEAHPLPRYSYSPEDPTTAKIAEGPGDPFRQPFTGAFILLLEVR